MVLDGEGRLCFPRGASRVTPEAEPAGEIDRSAALDGWVGSFDRELEQSGDFATSVAAMTAHGCFDVRAVVERWILANPTGDATRVQVQPALQEPVPLRPAVEEAPALAEADAPRDPTSEEERTSQSSNAGSSPDIAYFHSLLQGGIERREIYEAFPGFRFVIEEAIGQYEAAAPILSDAPAGPSRQDLNDEIRRIRQELQKSRKPERRRWRRD
jgi:hypothetical protein